MQPFEIIVLARVPDDWTNADVLNLVTAELSSEVLDNWTLDEVSVARQLVEEAPNDYARAEREYFGWVHTAHPRHAFGGPEPLEELSTVTPTLVTLRSREGELAHVHLGPNFTEVVEGGVWKEHRNLQNKRDLQRNRR